VEIRGLGRDKIQKNDGYFKDGVWNFFHMVEPRKEMEKTPEMLMFFMEHASQEGGGGAARVEFCS